MPCRVRETNYFCLPTSAMMLKVKLLTFMVLDIPVGKIGSTAYQLGRTRWLCLNCFPLSLIKYKLTIKILCNNIFLTFTIQTLDTHLRIFIQLQMHTQTLHTSKQTLVCFKDLCFFIRCVFTPNMALQKQLKSELKIKLIQFKW